MWMGSGHKWRHLLISKDGPRNRSAAAVTYPDGIPNPWLWKSLLLTHSRSRSTPWMLTHIFHSLQESSLGGSTSESEAKTNSMRRRAQPCSAWGNNQDGRPRRTFLSILIETYWDLTCYPNLWSTLTHVWSASMNVDNHSIARHSVWLQSSTLGWKNDTVHQWNHCKKRSTW